MRIIFMSAIALLIFSSSCTKKAKLPDQTFNPNTPHQELSDTIKKMEEEKILPKLVNWKEITDLNQKALIDLQLGENEAMQIDSVKLFSVNLLPRLYKFNGGEFIWSDQNNIEDAYRAIELSYLDGLIPSDYHQKELNKLKDKILQSTVQEQKEALLAKHEIVLTDAMLLLGFHLMIGKIDPASIDPNWNYKSKIISKKKILDFLQLVKDNKVFDGLDQLRPKPIEYKAMMNAMRYYKGIEGDTWTQIKGIDKIELGDTSKHIPIIRERLSLCCQWNEYVSDSSVYDSSLYAGIVDFQKSHGLDDDGVIGAQTIELLNLTPKQRIAKLKVNMERLRWLDDEVHDYSVEVNIAAFQLYVKKHDELIYQCNVMTGKPYHKTPIFTEQMKYIDLNPTWTVPYSIATKELLPKLQKEGQAYLTRNNMELLQKSGKSVKGDVDYSSLSRSNFPYYIRQKPGAKNALGEVKFMFPNKYAVYLHDTQSKSLFARSSRAFSHGCIRVESPLKLAVVLLDDRKKWDRKKIDKVIATRKTKTVSLKKDVQVKLLYYTAGLFPNGTMYYLPDVYSRDESILELLEQDFTYNANTLNRVYPNQSIDQLEELE